MKLQAMKNRFNKFLLSFNFNQKIVKNKLRFVFERFFEVLQKHIFLFQAKQKYKSFL